MLKIAVAAVALGMVVMLVAVSTGVGLQREIRRNIAAFAGHIQLTAPQQGSDGTTQSVSLEQDFYPRFTAVPQVKHVQTFAQRAGILKTDHEFEGVVLKGLGRDYDLSGLSGFVKSGKMPRFGQGEASDSLLISQNTADALGLSCGERVKMYFIRDSGRPILRYFTIAGIFKSNIAEFDKNYALGDLRAVQSINRWDSTQVGGFELILHNAKELPAATERVLSETQWKFHVTNIATEYGALLDWVAMFDVNIVVILGIMILVCGVNMITVLLILILEKTSFIGMMKSRPPAAAADLPVERVLHHPAGTLLGQPDRHLPAAAPKILRDRYPGQRIVQHRSRPRVSQPRHDLRPQPRHRPVEHAHAAGALALHRAHPPGRNRQIRISIPLGTKYRHKKRA